MLMVGDYVRCSEYNFKWTSDFYYIKSIDGDRATIVVGAKWDGGACTRIADSRIKHNVPLSSLTIDKGDAIKRQVENLDRMLKEICLGRNFGETK